jgi:hypothetical protein
MPRWPEWTGLSEKRWRKDPDEEIRPAKTAWDWLQLVAVPLMLAVLALIFNGWLSGREADREEARAQRDRDIAREARLDGILTGYLADTSKLVLDRDLLRSRFGSDVQSVARTLSLAAVRRLDGRRKGEVLKYLMDSRLLGVGGVAGSGSHGRGGPRLKVDVEGADLRDADLTGEVVSGILRGADLRNARFDSATLDGVEFGSSDLRGASFRKALSVEANFTGARLNGAAFDRADMIGPDDTAFDFACLTNASFRKADLRGARWGRAKGLNVDFAEARELIARSLKHAELFDSNVGAARRVVGQLPAGWAPTGRKKPSGYRARDHLC